MLGCSEWRTLVQISFPKVKDHFPEIPGLATLQETSESLLEIGVSLSRESLTQNFQVRAILSFIQDVQLVNPEEAQEQ